MVIIQVKPNRVAKWCSKNKKNKQEINKNKRAQVKAINVSIDRAARSFNG
jgi:hypothetical protein